MRPSLRLVIVVAATSSLLTVVPATAPAQDIGDVLGTTILNDTLTQIGLPQVGVPQAPDPNATTPPDQTTPAKPAAPAHPLGYYCRGESKKHVRGQRGTPFSQCVAAMEKLWKGESNSARGACRSLSHRHVNGIKQTPYAACVSGGKKLLADLNQ